MSNSIDNLRSGFFPNSKEAQRTQSRKSQKAQKTQLFRNSDIRSKEIQNKTKLDAKVGISDAVKDFSRIKAMVDKAPNIDNSDKIAKLKAQIESKQYKVDYDQLADKMLRSEF